MVTCEVCSLAYPENVHPAGCPNQFREFSARFRKPIMMEFTRQWHEDAGRKIQAHRAAQAAIAEEMAS